MSAAPDAPPHRGAATVVLCLGLFVLGLDLTILNVAIPDLQADLSPPMAQVQWIVDGYALVLGGTVLAAGAVTDRMGRRRAFVLGLAVCGATSVLGATATDPGQVVAARGGMGAGAALIMPATLSVITHLYPEPALRRRAIAVWAAVGSAGGLTGPVLGGWLVEHFSWRAGFWINLPVAAVAITLAFWLVPESRAPNPDRIDLIGAALSSLGLLALVWGIIEAPTRGWASPPVLAAFTGSLLLLTAFLGWQQRCRAPMLPLPLLRESRIAAGATALALMSFALFGALFVITLYLQGVLGFTPWEAGLHTLPLPGALGIGALTALPLLARRDERVAIALGLALVTVAFAVLAGTGTASGYPRLAVFQLIAGFGAGLVAAAGTESVMGAVPPDRAGLGSAINDATRQVGSSLGVAVQGSLLTTFSTSRLHALTAHGNVPAEAVRALTGNPSPTASTIAGVPAAGRLELLTAARRSFVDAMAVTATTAGAVTLAATVGAAYWLLRPPTTRKHRTGPPGPATGRRLATAARIVRERE